LSTWQAINNYTQCIMPNIANVIVDIALNREFDYLIPDHLCDMIDIGFRVTVPFGKRYIAGYVVGLSDTSECVQLKEIQRCIGSQPVMNPSMLRLAQWISHYYISPLESCVQSVLPSPIRKKNNQFKEQYFVELTHKDHKKIDKDIYKKAPRQAKILDLLHSSGSLFMTDLIKTAEASPQSIRALERKGLVSITSKQVHRNPLRDVKIIKTHPLSLMPQQQAALDAIKASMDEKKPRALLIHGVTGSGKTEVYMQSIEYARRKGQGAIILVPEISLTPQTVDRFRSRFGDEVAVLHSHLADGERHDEWHRIRRGEAVIAIGPRSAVFAPISNLGLLVVDEEHENSYKQEESPRYHARDVAIMRGTFEHCTVVLGTATPSLAAYYNTQKGKFGLIKMNHRVDHRSMPLVKIVDMRIEAQREGKVYVLSRELTEAIQARLDRTEQVILFLNRRGYSSSLICPMCGFVAECDACSISMTYHKKGNVLRCHICGHLQHVPEKCPNPKCQDPGFRYVGVGTQKVEDVIQKVFPKAVIKRMDTDTTVGKNAHARVLGDFRVGKIDILLGTQMIAKGLDFPNVTLVGVISADVALHMPDFRAGERTFQLLTQVAGRAGRGDIPGEVIIQTYTPFHPSIQAARRLDYDAFYDQEIEFRRELNYPPFSRLVCVTFRGMNEAKVEETAKFFLEHIQPLLQDHVTISDPVPAPIARIKGSFRYQIMIRSAKIKSLNKALHHVSESFKAPKDVKYSIDIDAVNIL
jgi:primosomal protein N' (replication factor Y)